MEYKIDLKTLKELLCLVTKDDIRRYLASAYAKFEAMKIVYVTAALLSAACAPHANAASVEVGAGIAQAQTHGNGTWCQEGFAHTLKLQSPAFLLGVTGDISPRVRWHVDAVSLGTYSVDSWDTPVDANYNAATANHCNGTCLPLVHILGSGSVYGIAATLEAHTTGDWQLGVAAGPFLYRATWNLSVPNWQAATGSPGNVDWNSSGGVLYSYQNHWALGYTVGASISHGPLAITLAYYADGHGFAGHGSDPWPPLWKGQSVVMVTYKF
jgi:hypothetical protein